MMGLIKLTFLCAAAVALQGCLVVATPLLISAGEAKACPPEVARQARQFQNGQGQLRLGQTPLEVSHYIGVPESQLQPQSAGTPMLVWRYRTGHRACSYMPTRYDYTELKFQNNRLISVGGSDPSRARANPLY